MNILCGYNVNIDSVYNTTGEDLAKLLIPEYRQEVIQRLKEPPGTINSIPDFIAGLVMCMRSGTGAEWLVHDSSVAELLKKEYFPHSTIRMGGNAGIMTNVLSRMGASKVVPNVARPSSTQMSLFSKKATYFPEEIETNAICEEEDEEELIHFVFDFKKGERFSFYGEDIEVPRENRFIATYDSSNIQLAINRAFKEYAEENIEDIDGALISGFHMLMENYPDGSGYVDKFSRAFEQMSRWKQANRELPIHTEFGDFSNREIAVFVFSKLPQVVDSIGMNEDELAMIHQVHGISPEAILRMEAPSIIEAATIAASRYGLKRMIVHTREFILSICKKGYAKPALEIEAMEFGARCSAAFAATGKLEGNDAVEKITSGMDESTFGLEQVQRTVEFTGGKRCGNGAFGEYDDHIISISPTILCDDPIATVGLGDTLAAATFLRQLELSS